MANGGPNNPIRINPFFDGESPERPANAGLIQPNTGGAVQAAPIAPGPVQRQPGYVDAADQQLADGRTMAQVMRPGPEGLRGTVIPHATPGGIPGGTYPHETASVEVNVDPHLGGQGARVRLGAVNRETIARAEEMAREVTPDPYDTATSRMRAAAVMQGIAAQTNQPVGDVTQFQPPPTTPVTAPGNIAGPHQAAFAAPAPAVRRTRPLEHFNQEPQDRYQGRPLRPIEMEPSNRPMEYGAPPPPVQVAYEIEGFGIHRANYHDVIRERGFLVLVYNTSYQGGTMYEPPSGQDAPVMAVEVAGDSEVHLVHTTGFSYSYHGYQFCILMIERSAPAEVAAQQGT